MRRHDRVLHDHAGRIEHLFHRVSHPERQAFVPHRGAPQSALFYHPHMSHERNDQ